MSEEKLTLEQKVENARKNFEQANKRISELLETKANLDRELAGMREFALQAKGFIEGVGDLVPQPEPPKPEPKKEKKAKK